MAYIEKRVWQHTDESGQVKEKTAYRVQVRLKGHPTVSKTFDRKTDATKWAQKTETEIRERRYFKKATAEKHTLTETLDRWEKDALPRFKDQAKPKVHIRYWRESIGAVTLADLTPSLIIQYRDKLIREGKSDSTANRYTTTLSRVLSAAEKDWEWLDESPMRKVRKLKEPRGRVRFLDDDERARLLNACQESHNPDLYLAVLLSLSTGARRSEIWGLTWSQIDFNKSMATFHETKNNERRTVPIRGKALELLTEKSRLRRIDTDLLFPGLDPQKPIDFRTAWENAVTKAELTDFRWHDLRHSTASYLAMSGATPSEIAAVLGHKTLAMVKRYAHLTEQHTSAILERMNSKFIG
ncbi:tyrosine-type recombinase/integrase [bacterium]|nr:tyrosine-type recombinase/integrase [bacterium]